MNNMLFRKRVLLAACAAVLGSFSAHAQPNRGTWLAGGTLGFSRQAQEQHPWNQTPATTAFRINPRLGYFITGNVAAGVHLGYGHTSEKTETPASNAAPNAGYSRLTTNPDFTRKRNEYTAGLLVQRYWRLGERLHLFIQGDGAYTGGRTKTKMASATTPLPAMSPLLSQHFGSDTAAYAPVVIASPVRTFSADGSTYATGRLAFSLSPGLVYLATPRLGLTLMMGEAALQFKSTSLPGPSDRGLAFDSYGLDLGARTLRAGVQFHL
jgi:hypothetical protein